jgi:hypothetical protein
VENPVSVETSEGVGPKVSNSYREPMSISRMAVVVYRRVFCRLLDSGGEVHLPYQIGDRRTVADG